MPGPRGVITVNGNMERSLRIEEHTAALAVEVQSGLLQQHHSVVPSPWTPSKGPELHCSTTARLVKSSISNSAFVLVEMK